MPLHSCKHKISFFFFLFFFLSTNVEWSQDENNALAMATTGMALLWPRRPCSTQFPTLITVDSAAMSPGGMICDTPHSLPRKYHQQEVLLTPHTSVAAAQAT